MRIVIIHSPPHGEVPFRNIGLTYLYSILKNNYDTEYVDISYIEDNKKTDYYKEMIEYLSQKVGRVGDLPDLSLLLSVIFPEYFNKTTTIAELILKKVDRYFEILKDRGDIFLFSNNVLTMYFSSALAKRLKQYGKITIGGGTTTHFIPFTRFALFSMIYDFVVIGEGEEVLPSLLNDIIRREYPQIAGVYYKKGDNIIGKGRHYNRDINKPEKVDLSGNIIKDFIPIIAGRGCPHRCRFCSESYYWKRFRIRNVESVIDEMYYQYGLYGIKDFHFHDDAINANLHWFDNFIKKLAIRSVGFRWESFCTPYGLHKRRLELMKESGCVLLKMGVQSFSDNVLRRMGRPSNSATVLNTILNSVKIGISMHFDLLTCFPGETEKDHKENIKALKRIYDFSNKVYFSPNPFYLSTGSYTMMKPKEYNIKMKYFDCDPLPTNLSQIVEKSGKFPDSFEYGIDTQTVRKRLDDYHKILIGQNKDYLFLGRKKAISPKSSEDPL